MCLARWANRRPHTLKFCIHFTNTFYGLSGRWTVGEAQQIWVQASSDGAERGFTLTGRDARVWPWHAAIFICFNHQEASDQMPAAESRVTETSPAV